MKSKVMGAAVALAMMAAAAPAYAGSETGNFMVRVQGTVVDPSSSATVSAGGAVQPTWDAEVSTEVLPTLTLSYFLNKNIAVELFCCFAKLNAEGKGGIDGLDLGDFWVFPPALTLQYHFDNFGAFKPYVGAGVQYIHFFDQGNSGAGLGNAKINLDDAFGFTLQAGIDVSIGGGWYLNADIKKTWIDTDASWEGTAVTADVDINPWIYSLGVGYRFNLDDVFARRAEAAPLK
jgi:outer membrane protein